MGECDMLDFEFAIGVESGGRLAGSIPSCMQQARRRKMALERQVGDRLSCVSPQDRCAEDCVSPAGMPASAAAPSPLGNCRSPSSRILRVVLGTDVQRIAHRPACSRPANAWRRGWLGMAKEPLSPRRPPLTLAPKTPPGRLLHAGGE